MKRASLVVLVGIVAAALVTAAVLSSCDKNSKKRERQGSPVITAERPAEVWGVVELPSGNDLGKLAKVVDIVQPGASQSAATWIPQQLALLVGATSLEGADMSKPVRCIVVDAEKHREPVALVLSVSDADALEKAAGSARVAHRNGIAVIGAPDVMALDRLQAYAHAISGNGLEEARATVFVEPVVASLRGKVATGMQQLQKDLDAGSNRTGRFQALFETYSTLVSGLVDQTEIVEIVPAGKRDFVGLDVIMQPYPDSQWAKILATQEPHDFREMSKLPSSDAMVLMSGQLKVGPARDAAIELVARTIAITLGKSTDDLRHKAKPWIDLYSGSFGLSIAMPSLMAQARSVQILHTEDTGKALAHMEGFMTSMAEESGDGTVDLLGIEYDMSYAPNALEHDGVSIGVQKTIMDARPDAPPMGAVAAAATGRKQLAYVASVEPYLIMASGNEGIMRSAIDRVRGKGAATLPALVESAVKTARQHEDSLLFVLLLDNLPAGASLIANRPTAAIISAGVVSGSARMFFGAASVE